MRALNFELTMNTLDEVLNLMNGTAIYAFVSPYDQILYVGKTTDLKDRFERHRNWITALVDSKEMSSINIFYCDKSDLDEIETMVIKKYKPPMNMNHNPDYSGGHKFFVAVLPGFLTFKFTQLMLRQNSTVGQLGTEAVRLLVEKYENEETAVCQ